MDQTILTIISTVMALLGGAFGVKLLDKWFDRAKQQANHLEGINQREFADNEQARRWLQEQLRDRDLELDELRKREITLMERVGDLAEKVARQEERTAAQATQIKTLQDSVSKWGSDYAEMKQERNDYRTQKHSTDNALTALQLRAQIAEKDLAISTAEIDRLRGQLDTLIQPKKDGGP